MKKNLNVIAEYRFQALDLESSPTLIDCDAHLCCFRLLLENGKFVMDGHIGPLNFHEPLFVPVNITRDTLFLWFHRWIDRYVHHSNFHRSGPFTYQRVNEALLRQLFS